MKVILTMFAVLLALPVVLLLGIALGPAALVMLFIAGFALLIALANLAISRNRG